MAYPLINLVKTTARWRRKAFIRKLGQVTTIQESFLRSLLQVQQNTALGRDLNLPAIKTVDQFRSQVPRSVYSDYQPYFDRAAQGEMNVVTPEPIIFMNLSSGSTGNQKLVPITRRAQRKRAYANQIALGCVAEAAQRHNLSLGKMLITSSANPIGQTSGGIAYGHVSSNQLRATHPWVAQAVYVHPLEALFLKDTLTRIYICLLFALRNSDLTILSGIFPVVLLQLCAYLEKYGEAFIDDLGRGEIPDWLILDSEIREKLTRKLGPAPERAKQLAQILKSEGRLLPKDIWPKLAVLITARGGPSNFYFEKFPEYFGDLPIFGGTYAASEAVLGSHRDFNTDGVLLAIESNFFEFIPVDQWDEANPITLLPHEVKLGELYRILITNYSGFYRYDIGDVVEVVGFNQKTPIITFRYRQGGALSAISEKTTESHAVQVMSALQEKHHLTVEDFCISVSGDVIAPFYVLDLELSSPGTLEQPKQLLADFDQLLQSVNMSYALKRGKDDIASPQINVLKAGSFARLRQQKLDQGALEASQAKLPHINRDRNFLKEAEIVQHIKVASD
ncbi:MAG: GH3 auxin-responsive promoter family protein [Leptolyngbyaceae cyanobacterium MO_188.B28]|nr:GH3 auxin-responsive promoter family protein [Leptolyngbyaceae cyanobacterium MO_188.B28]